MNKNEIIRGLEFLSKHDKNHSETLYGFKTYGADKHKFILNSTVSEKEVRKFEEEFQIELPKDYVEFITEIGNGGAGPGNGLFPLDKCNCELENPNRDFLKTPFPHTKEWNMENPFEPDNEEYHAFNESYYAGKFVSGAIRISHYGCGIMYMLVVSGQEKGHIWVDDRCSEYGIYPAVESLSFEKWYMDWLEESISNIQPVKKSVFDFLLNTEKWNRFLCKNIISTSSM
jgi:protein involved in ribonucleotide reduction